MCGDSYSSNFVTNTSPMAAFVFRASSSSGLVSWGKQFTQADGTAGGTYISIIKRCHFIMSSQKILMAV